MTTRGLRPAEQAVLDRLPTDQHSRHGIPDLGSWDRRCRGVTLVRAALEDAGAEAIDLSPLGAGWSGDVDVTGNLRRMRQAVVAQGWPCLDTWLAGIGSPARDVFAVSEGTEVLTSLDLSDRGKAPIRADGTVEAAEGVVGRVVDRAHRRGEVRLREVLEIMRLSADGAQIPEADEVIRGVRVLQANPARDPVPLQTGSLRRRASGLRRRVRPRLAVAVSGVDGAGKSTTASGLAEALSRCGLPVSRVWARPGMNIGPLDALARGLKRLTGRDPAPGVRRVATGATDVSSRQGLAGWVWSLLVSLAFAADVTRQQAHGRGVVLYDRHHADALATLEVLYRGADLRLQQRIVAAALPVAALTVYLDIDVDTAVSRKPDDPIGPVAVRAQLERYAARVHALPNVLVLDATRPTQDLVHEILTRL